jgi:hypothetical protein
MELTASNVHTVLVDCLRPGLTNETTTVEGIINSFRFSVDKLKYYSKSINKMLDQLPFEFREDKGGGWSFLQAGITNKGIQWGDQREMEILFALGLAIGSVITTVPRKEWKTLPGGMPYYAVLNEEHRHPIPD